LHFATLSAFSVFGVLIFLYFLVVCCTYEISHRCR
jgi:hypothetical protein